MQEAIESVLAQTYRDFEIIVVDDGSTDGTGEALSARYGDQIRYIWQENQERSVARNTGIAHAQGEYIAFLDADDYWHPTKLEKQLALLELRRDLGMVYCHIQTVSPDDVPLPTAKQLRFPSASDTDLLPCLAFGNFLGSSSAVVRRAVFDLLGGFDPRLTYIEDWDFSLRVAVHYPIGCVPELLTFYRRHPGNPAQRAVRYKVQDAIPTMIERNLNEAGFARCAPPLRSRAIANAWWFSAKLDYAIGRPLEAMQRFARGLEYDFDYLVEPDFFVADVVNSALGLAGIDETPIAEAQAFVETVFSHLPPAAAHLRSLRRQALGRLHAGYLFSAGRVASGMPVWQHWLYALVHDPRWARNLGLWSITGEAIVGQEVASAIRNALRFLAHKSTRQVNYES